MLNIRIVEPKVYNPVPDITDPLGAHWRQPDKNAMLFNDKQVFMDQAVFDELAEYSSSIPSGKYIGKMWKCLTKDGWILRWYATDADPKMLLIERRQIIIF